MFKKFLVVFTVLLVVVLVSGCGEKKEKNQDASPEDQQQVVQEEIDTSNWNVYQNEEFGFRVKYPKEFAYKENNRAPYPSKDTNPQKDYYKFGVFFNENNDKECFPIYVDIKELIDPKMDLDGMINAKNEFNGDLLPKYKFQNIKKIKSEKQIEFLFSDNSPNFLNAVTIKDGDYYIISTGSDKGGAFEENCSKIYLKVLESFELF